MLAVPILAWAGVAALSAANDGRALPGVTVGGIEVAGLDRAAAEARLRAELPSLTAGSVTLVVDDQRREITYADLGRDYAIRAMLDAALAHGRAGNPIEQALVTLRALVHGEDVAASTTYDAAALERLVAQAAGELVVEPRDASVVLSASGGFEVVPGQDGRRVDQDAAEAAVASAIGTLTADDVTVTLSPAQVAPTVTTAEATEVARQASAMAGADLTLEAGDDTFTIPAADVAAWLDFESTADGGYRIRLARDRVTTSVTALAEQVNREAVDAGYTMQGVDFVVTPSVVGRTLDVEETVSRIAAALKDAGAAQVSAPLDVRLAVTETQPALTTEAAQAALPQMTVIGTWTTYFTPNPGDFWGENIAVPTRILDGYVIAPGEWFEFWSAIGPVTPERGYGPGGAIINGRSVPTGALGGGICSTSTTLFNAAARAGLEIGDRTNHYYFIPRYPTGLDATVAIADGAVTTLSFRNDTPYPIIIRGYNGYGVVRFDLVSVPTGRTVVFSEPMIWNQRAAVDEIEYTDELAPGVQQRVEYPHDGFEVNVTRTVYDAAGALLHQETYYSNYRVVNGIILEGRPAEAEATPSPSPSPAP